MLPTIPSNDTIPIEIVALDLRNIAAITPLPGTGIWAIQVDLSPSAPSTGTMTIQHSSTPGGTFDWQIDLCPHLTFIEFTLPFRTATLDYCVDIDPAGIPIQVSGHPWAHAADLAVNSPLSGPDFFPAGTVFPQGATVQMEPIETATAPPSPPSLPSLGIVGLGMTALLLLGFSARLR